MSCGIFAAHRRQQGPALFVGPAAAWASPALLLPCPWPLARPTVLPPPFPAIILLLLVPENRCSHLPSTHESHRLCPSLSRVILVRAHLWGESPQVWTNLLGEVSGQAPLSLQYCFILLPTKNIHPIFHIHFAFSLFSIAFTNYFW